jgi:lipoprotein NlpD
MMDMHGRHSRIALLTAAAAMLAACASDQPASVEDRSIRSPYAESDNVRAPDRVSPAKPLPSSGTYRVQGGDTLYAIAFNHGVDFRDLAAWNHIPAPYRIYVGQELNLSAPMSTASSGNPVVAPMPDRASSTVSNLPPSRSAVTNAAPPPKPQNSSPMFETVEPANVAQESAPAPKPVTPVAPPPQVAKPPVVAAPVEPPKSAEPAPQLNAGGVAWHWPASGSVIGTYVAGDQTKQGVDIAGNEGDPITATADGEVVYSGNGLIGYGELIIIKHNASFLSAYGHNRKRLVQEGDKVKAGQRIAEMGASAAARNELHFEIRKNGKPVNPLDYLPVR